ncbi:MAG TPA: GNAT family N-acetyltransferase [Bacteroidia bacterium]|nr:GNAT family N-acetyltransferase [Bacteroidia bacterium]
MEQNPLVFRKAEEKDIPFLIETIVAAEKSGTDVFSYSRIFELPESEIRKILVNILAEDATGQELCFSDYLIAEYEGKVAGAVAGWIEGESGQPGTIIKGTLFKYFIPERNLELAASKMPYINEVHHHWKQDALIIDIGLTLPEFRGKGILAGLMKEKERLLRERRPDINYSQIHVLKSNTVAFKIYSGLGYTVLMEKASSHPEIVQQWLPCDKNIVMEKFF